VHNSIRMDGRGAATVGRKLPQAAGQSFLSAATRNVGVKRGGDKGRR
jgi:hypothetical protein